jgi:hypothetical protein
VGNLQCTFRDLDALGRCAGRDDCPAPSDTWTAGIVSILLGAESAYRFNTLALSCSSSMTRSAFMRTDCRDC